MKFGDVKGSSPGPLGLICNPYHRGGITRWMVDMAVEWTRQGGESWFVAPRPRVPFINGTGRPTVLELMECQEKDELPSVTAPAVGAEFEFGTEMYRANVYARAVQSAIPAGVPIIVTDDPAAWLAGAWMADRNPLVAILHSDETHYYDLARRYGGRASAIVCVSERVKKITLDLMHEVANWDARGITTIPCGTVLPPWTEKSARVDGVLRLVWVGRMEERQKRVSDLPKIAACLRDAGLDFVLTILGDGPEEVTVREACALAGIGNRLNMLGWRPSSEVQNVLGSSDLLLSPSNFEGMSVAVMEALGLGCGVVASRVSGVEDYETHTLAPNCLWVHTVGNVAEAAAKVMQAAQISRDVRSRSAKALAQVEFSISRCVGRYAAFLETVAPLPASKGHTFHPSRRRSVALISYPVAASRIARLWLAGRYRRAAAGT